MKRKLLVLTLLIFILFSFGCNLKNSAKISDVVVETQMPEIKPIPKKATSGIILPTMDLSKFQCLKKLHKFY